MKGWKNNNDPWVPLHVSDQDDPSLSISTNTNHTTSLSETEMEKSVEADVVVKVNRPPPENPLHTFIDSERYIQSLEKKLQKLKKKNENPSSKDIINSLALFHEDQMSSYVNSDSQNVHNMKDLELDGSLTPSYMKRKLFPELQAINVVEVAELVKEDFVEKSFEELSVNDSANSELCRDRKKDVENQE